MVLSFCEIFLPRVQPSESVRVPARLSTSECVRLVAIRVVGHKLFSALCPGAKRLEVLTARPCTSSCAQIPEDPTLVSSKR